MSISIVYNSGSPISKELAEKTLPELAVSRGITIRSSSAVLPSTQDYTAALSAVVVDSSDAAVILVSGASNATVMTQLRQAGFAKPVVGLPSAGGGNLVPAGAAARDIIWPNTFSIQRAPESAARFVAGYRAANAGQDRTNYAAEGHDAAWMIARAIKVSGGASRDDIRSGLDQVAAEGFDGALGSVTFQGRDERAPGVLLRWDGEREVLVG